MKFILLSLVLLAFLEVEAARIKDLASIRGVRSNQLFGYGIVVGLPGTGDKDLDITQNSLEMVLKGLGVELKSKKIATQNAAAVIVSASLGAFARMGSTLDINIASVGSAASLAGGTLLMTPLKAADGQVYAIASGKIESAGAAQGGGGQGGGGVVVTLKKGAILEREVKFDFSKVEQLRYLLYNPDFTTAARMVKRVNMEMGAKVASALDGGTVDVAFPPGFQGTIVDLVARIENLEVEPDRPSKVVINRKTGTVILGSGVEIAPVAIAHNNLRIEVEKELPNPAAREIAAEGQVGREGEAPPPPPAETEEHSLMHFRGGTQIADIVAGLNEMGATPQDLISILESLKESKALVADLVIQ